jgi:hypothetical protein
MAKCRLNPFLKMAAFLSNAVSKNPARANEVKARGVIFKKDDTSVNLT